MATRKTGPVKPPTLDLQARKTPAAKKSSRTARPKTGSAGAKVAQSESVKPANTKTSAASSPQPPSQQAKAAGGGKNQDHVPEKDTKPDSAISLTSLQAAAIGVAGGAVLGTLLSVGILVSGLLQPVLPRQADPRLEELNTRVGISEEQVTEGLVGFNALNDQVSNLRLSTEQALGALSDQSARAQGETEDRLNPLLARLTELENQLEQVANQPQPVETQSFDPGTLEAQIAVLATRLDAIAAGASTDDAQKLATDLDALRLKVEALASLQSQLIALQAQVSASQQTIEAAAQTAQLANEQANATATELARLADDVQTQELSTPPAPDTALSSQIPLALMGLDAALAAGQPFETELQTLNAIVPDLTISPALADFAASGLPTPEEISQEFGAAMPALLGARPISPDAGWQEGLWTRLKSLLALRPTSQSDAQGIDATIARLETAMTRRDYASANQAIAELPPVMRQTLGDVAPQLEALEELQSLHTFVRNNALMDQQSSGVSQ